MRLEAGGGRRWAAVALWLGLLVWAVGERTSRASAPPARPRLLLLISVDGLSWPRLADYRPWYRAGLARLMDEGLAFTECRYQHLNTETGPGHASLGAGAPPRITGIVANNWFEPGPNGLRLRYCADQSPRAGEGGAPTLAGPGNLRVPLLGDRLRAAHAGSRVVALSGKDRGAIFLAARDPAAGVFWYDQARGVFTTSTAYRPAAAMTAAVEAWNRANAGPRLEARYGTVWRRLEGPRPPDAPSPVAGLFDFQLPVAGLGWDHSLTFGGRAPASGVYYTPVLDSMVCDLALALLGDRRLHLGRGQDPDLLALSFSAQDIVSHHYGNESEEELDVLQRLDHELGRLLDALEALGPPGTVAIALSADHGFNPIPETPLARGLARGGRLVSGRRTPVDFETRLGRMLADALCLDPARPWIRTGESWNVFYDRSLLPARRTRAGCGPDGVPVGVEQVDAVLPEVVQRGFAEEIRSVRLVSQMGRWPADDPDLPFLRNDFDAERSGDAFLVPNRGVLLHWDPARGSGHGTIDEPDTHVPLILWGGGVVSGRNESAVTPYDLAPTLAALVGLELPDSTGNALLAAARPQP